MASDRPCLSSSTSLLSSTSCSIFFYYFYITRMSRPSAGLIPATPASPWFLSDPGGARKHRVFASCGPLDLNITSWGSNLQSTTSSRGESRNAPPTRLHLRRLLLFYFNFYKRCIQFWFLLDFVDIKCLGDEILLEAGGVVQ